MPPNGTIFGSRLESRKSHQKSTLTLTHKNIWSEGGFVFLISYMCFNACVSQQEGLLRGIREESWNQHRDLENHSGTFLEKLIQPIEAEWGNSHPSACNTLFFYWAVFLSLSVSLSLPHTHTQEVSPYVLGAEAVQTDDVTDRHVVTCMHRCCNFWNKSEHWKHFVRDVQIVKHYSILPFFLPFKNFYMKHCETKTLFILMLCSCVKFPNKVENKKRWMVVFWY